MNFDDPMVDRQSTHAEIPEELANLLAQCERDLRLTDGLLQELEGAAEESVTSGPSADASERMEKVNDRQSIAQGADAVRRLTANIEALSAFSARDDVQQLLQAMHGQMVRCVKLLPARR